MSIFGGFVVLCLEETVEYLSDHHLMFKAVRALNLAFHIFKHKQAVT